MQHRVVRANPVGGQTRAKTHRVVRVNPSLTHAQIVALNRMLPHEMKQLGLTQNQAHEIYAHASAYGSPGGKSEAQWVQFVRRVLGRKRERRYRAFPNPSTRFKVSSRGASTEFFSSKEGALEHVAKLARSGANQRVFVEEIEPSYNRTIRTILIWDPRYDRPLANPSAKFERCVQDVKKSNRRRSGRETKPYNPWAICHSSLKENPMPRTRRAKYNPARARAAKPFNEHHVDELVLYATNDEPSYRHAQAIMRNMATKARRGTYDPHLAVKAWLHWADRAAKKYAQENGTGFAIFSPADRREAAKRAVDYYAEETAEHLRRLPALRRR